jgi:hypothetical protein
MSVFAFYKKVYYGWWIVLACFLIAAYVSGGVFLNFTAFFQLRSLLHFICKSQEPSGQFVLSG